MDTITKVSEKVFTLEIESQKMFWTVELSEWTDGVFGLNALADGYWVGDRAWVVEDVELEKGDIETITKYLFDVVDSYDPTPY